MRQSQLFTKTKREDPKDEMSKNAKLLLRGGFVYKEMAGVYAFLPLGLRTFKKIEQIIREEMNAIGGQEVVLTALQEKELWEKTNRWSDDVVDNWFKIQGQNNYWPVSLGLGFTHEEPITRMMREHISSYRDLPIAAYQFQTKFRNESRAKSGIMRMREFVMKDLYSFSKDEKEHNLFYRNVNEAYVRIFKRVGIGDITYMTFASGGVFAEFSHEFQTLTDAGEDTIYINPDQSLVNSAVNKEVYTDEVLQKLGYNKNNLIEKKAVEVGNIFTLGTRFSEALGLTYKDEQGNEVPVFMGSYGIGPGRVMGTIVEALSDDKGIVWPESVAPFKVHLLVLGDSEVVKMRAEKLYMELNETGIEVLFDDRAGVSNGEKFNDSDLLGMPYRIVVSERSLKEGGFELKKRTAEKGEIIPFESIVSFLK